MNAGFTVEEILEVRGEALKLEFLNEGISLEAEISDPDLSSPGLALAGFTDRFPSGRMQVFGETEMTYLSSLGEEQVRSQLDRLFAHDIPAVFVTKGQEVPGALLKIATRHRIPVMRSALGTRDFYARIKPILEEELAPTTNLHGSLADVYGVGLLFVGKSGIGKSECVLDLVERGHRMVADDVVLVTRRGHDVLIGRGHELQRHHMEIRGIGIVDIRALFGIRATRHQKRIEVVVHLEHWEEGKAYDRTGLNTEHEEILGVDLPRVTVPLVPGKNITVVSEVVAMNHLLLYSGVDSAAEFDRRLQQAMRAEYLREDYE